MCLLFEQQKIMIQSFASLIRSKEKIFKFKNIND